MGLETSPISSMTYAARTLARELARLPAGPDRETGLGAARALVQLIDGLSRAYHVQGAAQRDFFRINSAQLDARGKPVPRTGDGGRLNKPDISYIDRDGRRVNIEIDTQAQRSDRHQEIVNQRDRAARNIFVHVDPWTGNFKYVAVRQPGGAKAVPLPRGVLPAELRGMLQPQPSARPSKPARAASRGAAAAKTRTPAGAVRRSGRQRTTPHGGKAKTARPQRELFGFDGATLGRY